jgi:phosphatidate phosphatase LPIN
MSDTEFETGKRGSVSGPSGGQKKASEAEQSWEWGQLPSSTTPQHSKDGLKKDKKDAKESSEGKKGGWGISDYLFGRNSKQNVAAKTASEAQGVYLDDLKDDEEMLKIYLGSRTRSNTISKDVDNEDAESGNGPSLPMSPHSVEGAIGFQPQSSEAADLRGHGPNVEISLCGNDPNLDFSSLLFEQSKMSFDDFLVHLEECPQLLNNPGLVVRIGDGPQFYKWEVAAPMIMSHVLYGRSLPQDLIEKLKNGGQGKKDLEKSGSISAPASASSSQERKSSWWPFGSRKENEDALTSNKMEKMEEGLESTPMEAVEAVTEAAPRKRRNDTTSSSEAESETERLKSERCKKTLRLTSELIKCLNLKKGANEIQFSVTTAYQGTTRCLCHVYLWHHSDKIVISDIDGTITKSDVLGHVFPMIGRDWAQSGVASLFTKIVNNGYHIVYLSARAIGQAAITKDYLASIKQGEVNLPDGPIFLNPTSLVNAFHREVIEKKPEEFKIACLRDIRKLFPDDKNPFYAGYGNRVNDVWAYQAVGIPMSRIFTINPKGELRHELTNAFQTSYGSMSNIVDHVFPPTDAHSSPSMALGYSNFTFWREPLPRITPEEENAETPQLALAGPEASPEDKSKESSPLAGPEASNAKETNSDSSSSSSSSQTTVVETIQNVEKINP